MNHPFQIPLIGGPLDNTCHEVHEVEAGWPKPDILKLPGGNGAIYYVYEIREGGNGYYLYTESTGEMRQ